MDKWAEIQKWEKIGQKIENGPRPEMGEKWPEPENGHKMGFGVIFPPFRAEGHFQFFGQFFPIFGFRPIFHSIPGGLTRKPRLSTPNMTGRGFHRTTEAIPRRPWKAKRFFVSGPIKTSIKKGTRGVHTRYDAVLLPFISIAWCPGRPVT